MSAILRMAIWRSDTALQARPCLHRARVPFLSGYGSMTLPIWSKQLTQGILNIIDELRCHGMSDEPEVGIICDQHA
jgi:hypothetical protein